MEQKIRLPLALLRAACIAAAEEDFARPYLEAVMIDKGHIVATDSAIMFWAKLDNVDPDITIVIPRMNVECFIKKADNFKDFICNLVYDTNTQRGYLEIPNCWGCHEVFQSFLSGLSYWQKVIPERCDNNIGFPNFAVKYHTKLDEIALELGSICKPKIVPNGELNAALVEFLLSEFDNVHACLAPLNMSFSNAKYCVEIFDEPDNAEPEQLPAASAEIALRAAKRLRADIGESFDINRVSWIRPALWQGTDQDHRDKMFYTEKWFSQPLHQYDNPEKAIEYLNALPGEVVRCFVGDILTGPEIHARTVEEVREFFAKNSKVDGHA